MVRSVKVKGRDERKASDRLARTVRSTHSPATLLLERIFPERQVRVRLDLRPSLTNLTPGGPFTPGTCDDLFAAAQAAPPTPYGSSPRRWRPIEPGGILG